MAGEKIQIGIRLSVFWTAFLYYGREKEMLIKTRIYLVALMLIVLSAAALIVSIRNKNANYCRYLNMLCCVCILYLFVDLAVLVESLGVSIGLPTERFLLFCLSYAKIGCC